MPPKRSKPLPAQCKATTPSGEPCRAKPHKEGLCFFHSDPKKAAELGRKGGRHRAVYSPDGLKEFAAPRSAADLRDLLGPVNHRDQKWETRP
jgi:general stress protein YciG